MLGNSTQRCFTRECRSRRSDQCGTTQMFCCRMASDLRVPVLIKLSQQMHLSLMSRFVVPSVNNPWQQRPTGNWRGF